METKVIFIFIMLLVVIISIIIKIKKNRNIFNTTQVITYKSKIEKEMPALLVSILLGMATTVISVTYEYINRGTFSDKMDIGGALLYLVCSVIFIITAIILSIVKKKWIYILVQPSVAYIMLKASIKFWELIKF